MNASNEERRLSKLLLASLVFVFGLQSMRFLFGSLTWYLRDTLGIAVVDLVPIALAPFLLGALIPTVSKWIGVNRALWLGAGLLVAARILNQISTDPGVDFWTSSLATMAFVGLVPILFSLGKVGLVGGVLLGLAIDSAIKGLGLSLDLAHQPGWRSVAAVVAIAAAVIWAIVDLGNVGPAGVTWGSGIVLLSIAPFLFAESLVLQSQGWTSAVTGVSGETAQLRIAFLNVVALYLAYKFRRNRAVYTVAVVLVVLAVIFAEASSSTFNILSLLAVPLAGVAWAGLVPEPNSSKTAASGFYLVVGLIFFLILGLAYYLPLDLSLGFTQESVRLVAALLLFGFGALGFFRFGGFAGVESTDWVFAGVAVVLPLVAFIVVMSDGELESSDASDTVRFMSYNVHSAFNTDGTLDVEAIARVIEDSDAEVVGLQELPRGRLISGTTDLLTLLKVRLGFEHVAYFGTTDPVWGNAVLSRYPIVDVETEFLPLVNTPMRRGYLGATIDVEGTRVLVISTHLQHVNDSARHDLDPEADLFPVHQEQIDTILAGWGGQSPAVLMGDFNARPDWTQVDRIKEAGWVDSWEEAGSGDGFTSNAADPMHRIDYIFHTNDMVAIDAGVFQSEASDHFPVLADLAFVEP